MPSRKKITPEEAVADLKIRKHRISKSAAKAMNKKFRTQHGKIAKAAKSNETSTEASIEFPVSHTFNKKAVTKLLAQKDCIGLRIYPAMNDENKFSLVLVGVDSNYKNIVSAELTAKAATTSKKAAATMLAGSGEADNDEILDEGQASPPYPEEGL